MALRTRWKVLGICGALAVIGIASMRYLTACEYSCHTTGFKDDSKQWFDVTVRGDSFWLTSCYYDFCYGGGEGAIDSGGRLHDDPEQIDMWGDLPPMWIERAPDGRPLALSYEEGDRLRSTLECSANHWWFVDDVAHELGGGNGLQAPQLWLVLLGLALGIPLSVLEARRASRRARGWRFASTALVIRLLLPLGCLALAEVWRAFQSPGGLAYLTVWPPSWVRDGICAIALGQILAAGIVRYRRDDDPKGSLRGALSIGTLLVIFAAYGSVLAFVSAGEWPSIEPATVMLLLWGLLYLSLPRLVWLALPRALRGRVRQAGLAVLLFAAGQVFVDSDSARFLLNVFWGGNVRSLSDEQLHALRIPVAILSVIAIGGAIAVVTLELVALLRRRRAAAA